LRPSAIGEISEKIPGGYTAASRYTRSGAPGAPSAREPRVSLIGVNARI